MGRKMIDMTGQRFGRLTVREMTSKYCAVGFDPETGRDIMEKVSFCVCDCDCGGKLVARAESIRRGKTSSCGCLRREMPTTCAKAKNLKLNIDALLEIMQQQGYSRCSLSRKLCKDRYYISGLIHYARNGKSITVATAQAIAEALNTDVRKFTRQAI